MTQTTSEDGWLLLLLILLFCGFNEGKVIRQRNRRLKESNFYTSKGENPEQFPLKSKNAGESTIQLFEDGESPNLIEKQIIQAPMKQILSSVYQESSNRMRIRRDVASDPQNEPLYHYGMTHYKKYEASDTVLAFTFFAVIVGFLFFIILMYLYWNRQYCPTWS